MLSCSIQIETCVLYTDGMHILFNVTNLSYHLLNQVRAGHLVSKTDPVWIVSMHVSVCVCVCVVCVCVRVCV